MTCNKCGAEDFRPIKEQVTQEYKKCGNCGYAPALEKAEAQNAKEWIEAMVKEHAELNEAAIKAEQELHDTESPTNLMIGRANKAKRLLEASDKKLMFAESLSHIVEGTESGQVTLIIPELGMWQLEWGDFNLFKAIGDGKGT